MAKMEHIRDLLKQAQDSILTIQRRLDSSRETIDLLWWRLLCEGPLSAREVQGYEAAVKTLRRIQAAGDCDDL